MNLVGLSRSYSAYEKDEVIGPKIDEVGEGPKTIILEEESKVPHHEKVAAMMKLSIEVPGKKNKENNPPNLSLKDFADYTLQGRGPARKLNEAAIHSLLKKASPRVIQDLRPAVINTVTKQYFNDFFIDKHDGNLSTVTNYNRYIFDLKDIKLNVRGPATCLYLALISRNAEGRLVSKAIGNFTPSEVQKYINGEANSIIHEFIEKAYDLFPNTQVFAAGMYNESIFNQFKTVLSMMHRNSRLQECINPWKVNQAYLKMLKTQNLENYLTTFDFKLNFGITEDGKVCVANGSRYSEDFRQFKLEEFTSWYKIQQKLLACSKIPLNLSRE